ncbi:hypothetical protein [Bosea sp. (in: a-proteobacteria)]|jgi:hypothetical protein|uniref:hypothetical protein n=1 Tax=Bosea sp. (in: a-proteobacteria) TaxID=1871050 RepID=UPI00356A7A00
MPYFDPFFEPRLKIDRATKHVGELASIVNLFDMIYHGSHTNLLRPSLYEVIPIIGDVVHNLRSSLDMIACDLVIDASGPKNRDELQGVYFPIASSAQDFERCLKKCGMNGTSASVKSVLREFEPWQDGRRGLWDLHQLSILDKHRTGIVVFRWDGDGGTPLKGDERILLNFPNGDHKIDLKFEDDRPYFMHPFAGKEVAPTLIEIIKTCSEIIRQLEPKMNHYRDILKSREGILERQIKRINEKINETKIDPMSIHNHF